MNARNPSHAFALTVVDELARCGVRHACLSPGSRSAALAMALAEDDRIQLHVCIDERSAAFMAIGIGRATRQPAVVVSTSGTATANFYPAVIEAEASRVPVIILTADRPPELRSTGANQTIDQLKMYGDAVRWFCEVGVPEERPDAPAYWRSLTCRAYAEAVGGPAGPVHVNAAMREPLVPEGRGYPHELDGRDGGSPWTTVLTSPRPPTEVDAAALADLVNANERGLVVIGDGVIDADVVIDFARSVGWPLVAEPLSNARRHDDVISTYDALLRTDWGQGHRPDVVIRCGRVATSKALAQLLDAHVRQVLIDPDKWWLDPGRSTSTIVAADVGPTLDAVRDAVGRRETRWAEEWQEADSKARAAIDAVLDESDEPNEPRTARDVAAKVPDGSNLIVGSSMPVRDLDWFMAPRTDLDIYANRGASGIDGFVSTAVGVAAATRRPTFALAGDLSMLHDQNGLLGVTARGLDVTFVVLNNDGGGIFSFLPQARFRDDFEKVFGTPHGVDFEKLAAMYGLEYSLLEKASDLASMLGGEGVRLIEVRTDRGANVDLHKRAWAAVATALTTPSA